MDYLFTSCWSERSQRPSKQYIELMCLLYMDGKILLLKTQLTLVVDYTESKLKLTWTLLSSLAFIVLDNTSRLLGGKCHK